MKSPSFALLALLLCLLSVPFFLSKQSFLRAEGSTRKHPELSTRPVIGILTQPDPNGIEYIAASYVKYAEAAGAQVIPIRYWWDEKQLKQTFEGVNGILFPGGGADIDPKTSQLFKSSAILFELAEKSNRQGQRFPIWGTCLGWELLAVLATKSYAVLNESGKFLDEGSNSITVRQRDSNIFKALAKSGLLREIENSEKIFYFSHMMGVTPEIFENTFDTSCWIITAEGKDRFNKRFVAVAENKCRPYYGVQFHPEKPLYEWFTGADIPHSFLANEVSRFFINFLSQELHWSRKGNFKDSEVFKRSIHNYPIKTLGNQYFFQVYLFGNSSFDKDFSETTEASKLF